MRQPTNKATRTEEEHSPSCPEVRIISDRMTLELFADDAFAMVQNDFLYYDYKSFENLRESSTFSIGYSLLFAEAEILKGSARLISQYKGDTDRGYVFYIFSAERIHEDSEELIPLCQACPGGLAKIICYSDFVNPGMCSMNLFFFREKDPDEPDISPEYFWRYRPTHYGSRFMTNKTGREQAACTYYRKNYPLDFNRHYPERPDNDLQSLAEALYNASDKKVRLSLLHEIISVLEAPGKLDFALVYKTVVGVVDPIVRGLKVIHDPSEMTTLYSRYYKILERRKNEQPGYSKKCKADFIAIDNLYNGEDFTAFYRALLNWARYWKKHGNATNRREVLDILDRYFVKNSLLIINESLEKVIRELISMDNPEVLYPEAILERIDLHIQCWKTIRQSVECVDACRELEDTHQLFVCSTNEVSEDPYLCYILMKKSDGRQNEGDSSPCN